MKRYIKNASEYVVAMGKGRKELGSWIEDHTTQVMIALAQLYVFPHGNRVHWRKEVWEKFFEMKRFTSNNKLPDPEFIMKNSFRVHEKQIPNHVRFVKGKEEAYTPRKDIDLKQLHDIEEAYFSWLSDYLSREDFLPKEDVLNKLNELGLGEQLTI